MKVLRDTFKALSDETRLQIMTLLLEHEELCVCDFVGDTRSRPSQRSPAICVTSTTPVWWRIGERAVDALSRLDPS